VSGSAVVPEGITNPPIDELLEATDSKYSLVIYAAKRARQINAYYSQLGEGLLEYVGPLVETHVQEKPLSIALREINDGLLTSSRIDPDAEPEDSGFGGFGAADRLRDGFADGGPMRLATDAIDLSDGDLTSDELLGGGAGDGSDDAGA
jgi:DNA-directed RNA polymerase subunit omega